MIRKTFAALAGIALLCLATPAHADSHHHRHSKHRHAVHRIHKAPKAPESVGFGDWSFSGGGDLIAKARRYMGTNPTGWARVWCGKFMAMIAPRAAARISNPNRARDWAELPRTHAHVGAIAVLRRGKRGGHVGVVTAIDANGNPTIVSGNHGGVVGEGKYDRRRVIAYVRP